MSGLDLSLLKKVKPKGGKIIAQCPACASAGCDKKGDHLAIYPSGGYSCVTHKGDLAHQGEIFAMVGIKSERAEESKGRNQKKQERVHSYHDADGNHVFDVVVYRLSNGRKDIRQRRPDGKGGFIWNLQGIVCVLYHLPQLLSSCGSVWIVEGEKDVDSLEAREVTATCNPMGASKWSDSYNEALHGRDVILCPDNDDPGRKHVEMVARSLDGVAATIRVVNWSAIWPDIPEKADVTDALENGITVEDIEAVAEPWELATQGALTIALNEGQVGNVVRISEVETIITADSFHFNDTGAATLFTSLHSSNLKFVKGPQVWLYWDGERWIPNAKEQAYRMAMNLPSFVYGCAAQLSGSARNEIGKWAVKLGDSRSLTATLSLAQNFPELLVEAADLDSDKLLVGVANGLVDLRTAEFRPKTPENLITKSLGTHFDGEATCPAWDRFLQAVFDKNSELITYVQRVIGYCLTGSVKEQCLFFAHGSGSNGKTTFFETINALEGDYGQKAPKSLFTKNPRGGDEQTNDLARLPGVRFLFGSEVENGSSMAESKVKDITGGDMITARFLHKEFFDFAPTHKLLMFGNHKPRISGTDNGIWRRIRLIPFLKTFEGAEKDPDLADKLRAELPGILNWAIKGCREWQKHGLRTPEVVERATNDYRNQEDLVGEFLTEEYIITKDSIHTLPKKELYNGYRTFCETNGYSPLGVRRFNEQVLTRPGVQEDRISTARIYRGLHHVDQP